MEVEEVTSAGEVSAGQPKQLPGPLKSLNFPATHALHTCPSGPKKSKSQVQFIKTLLPSPEYEPVGQFVHVATDISPISIEYVPFEHNKHADEPLTVLYVPATHALHSCPFGPVYP